MRAVPLILKTTVATFTDELMTTSIDERPHRCAHGSSNRIRQVAPMSPIY